MLASLLFVGSIVLVGLGNGVSASTAAAIAPAGSTAIVDDVSESRLDPSTRRSAVRRVTSRSSIGRDAVPGTGRSVFVEQLLVRVLRLAPPSWRGPPVLLM